MIIAGMQKSSTLDFPGNLSCVLFTRGCNMDCFYCHNRDILSKKGENLAMDEVFSFLEKRRGLLDGVVVSGGEPTLQPDLIETIQKIKKMGYRVKLDTNGQNPETLAALIEQKLLDYIAVDWKAPAEELCSVCGPNCQYEKTKDTLFLLLNQDIPFEARTTLYPGLSGEKLLALAGDLPPLPAYRLNFYRVPKGYRPEDEERILSAALTPADIRALEKPLRAVQPNLIF